MGSPGCASTAHQSRPWRTGLAESWAIRRWPGRLGESGYKRAVSDFSWQKVAETTRHLHLDLSEALSSGARHMAALDLFPHSSRRSQVRMRVRRGDRAVADHVSAMASVL